MSNDTGEMQQDVRASIIYSFFSACIPSILFIALDLALRDVFIGLKTIPWWFIFIPSACNIAVSRVLLLVSRKRSGVNSLIRIHFFIYFPAATIEIFFLQKTPLFLLYTFTLLLIQWIILYNIFTRFRKYMDFIKFVKGKHGRVISSKLRDNAFMVHGSRKSLKELKNLTHTLQLLLFIIISIFILMEVPFNLVSLLTCAASIVLGLIFSITLSICMDEYRFYVDGFSIDMKMKQKRVAYTAIILILVFFLVFPILQTSSFFSPGDIVKIWQWFIHLFPERKHKPWQPEDFEIQNHREQPEFLDLLQEESDKPPLFDMDLFLKILGIIITPLLIAGLLFFLFKPLFKMGLRNLFKGKNPLREAVKKLRQMMYSLKLHLRELVKNIKAVFHSTKKQKKYRLPESKSDPRLKQKKTSLKKRIQKNRVVKMFIKLVQWGARQKVTFHPSLGPKEYIHFMTKKIPERKEMLECIADTFEEAVFSDHIMETAAIKKYVRDIKEIIH